MVKELADGKRKLAAMTSELERYEKAFKSLASSFARNDASDVNLKAAKRDIEATHPVLQGFGLAPLLQFLEEYTEVRQSVENGTARLRQLGV
jgi:hypothetical protein